MLYRTTKIQEDKIIDAKIRKFGLQKLADIIGLDNTFISQCISLKVKKIASQNLYEKIKSVLDKEELDT